MLRANFRPVDAIDLFTLGVEFNIDNARRDIVCASVFTRQEKEKNKLLQQQLADQFKVQKQAFTDALIATGISRKEAEKRFMDYVKNKGTPS